jgi:hypothetical protein
VGPFREDSVDRRVVDGRLALGILRDGQALPLHARIQDPQDEIEADLPGRKSCNSLKDKEGLVFFPQFVATNTCKFFLI